MAKAVITNRIKKQVINSILADVNDASNNYYAAIGRSEDWNDSDVAPLAYNSGREERNFRLGMQSVKNITDIRMVVPRYNWASGAIYSQYDDAQVGYPNQPYYVLNDNNQVYMCVQQAKNAAGSALVSNNQPSGNTTGEAFATADGYVWKFLYSISALDATKFVSANYMPVKLQGAVDSDSPAAEVEQLAVQNAAVKGQITGFQITSGGSGYTSNPTVSVIGDGIGAKGVASIDGGAVTKVEIYDSSGTYTQGSGYSEASLVFTGGGSFTSEATGRVILGQDQSPLGFGADPRDDLRSTAIMFNTKPDGDESGDFIVNQDFRQVGLLKNPRLDEDSAGSAATSLDGLAAPFTESTGIALKKLKVSSFSQTMTPDNTIQGSLSQVKALIDRVDSSHIWYHQTEATGFGDFDSGESVNEIDGNGAGVLNATFAPYIKGELNNKTGDLMYVANRDAIVRDAGQTEDIKIVIQI